jgi:phosphoribosylaminoimidazole-succinocarboxamide synthase
MRVKRVNVIPDYSKLNGNTKNYLIPLECVARYFVYGSLWDRVRKGAISSRDLGFPDLRKLSLAEPLPKPFFEVTTKLEKVDRHLTTQEALQISGISLEEYEQLNEMTLKIDENINLRVRERGLIHVDGKKEFAFDENRNLMIVDTLGTADEDRFWDAEEYNKGRYVERSKEFVRQYYRELGYHEQLMKARETGMNEPPIPALPRDVVMQVSEIYIKLFEDLTGESFLS